MRMGTAEKEIWVMGSPINPMAPKVHMISRTMVGDGQEEMHDVGRCSFKVIIQIFQGY
jgi:hypothetical protein